MNLALRKLNEEGTSEFRNYLDGIRHGIDSGPPIALLTNPDTSDEIDIEVLLSNKRFATRFDLGVYLVEKLNVLNQTEISHDTGIWSWLGLFYFEQLAPVSGGKRRLAENYSYILSPDYKHHPRHSVRTTYVFVRDFGPTVQFMFSKALHERGEIVEQLAARQEFASCKGVIECAHDLYSDPHRKTFKRGAASKGKGSIRRFITVLGQFNLTYDIGSLSSQTLMAMLPGEFDRFRNAS